jgi:hypothetical protein
MLETLHLFFPFQSAQWKEHVGSIGMLANMFILYFKAGDVHMLHGLKV